MSNFAFLQPEWLLIHESATKAESMANTDARTACFYTRRALELAIAWLYKYEPALKLPYQDHLSALIHEPSFRKLVGEAVFTKTKLIKDLGNIAVHSTRKVAQEDALRAIRELFHVCYWLARTYGQKTRPAPNLSFSLDCLSQPSKAPSQSIDQLQKLEAELHARDEKLSVALSDKAQSDAELKQLRDEIAAAKKENSAQADTHDYSEAETRDYFIDLLLKEAGWALDKPQDREFKVAGMPNNEGVGYVDYVLWGDDGKPLAVIEAKRTRRDAKVGQQQARLYADCLEATYKQRPIILYTNGYDHWLWDDANYPPRAVQGFFKKTELELMIQRRSTKRSLSVETINQDIVERYYQMRAIRRIGEAFEKDHQRKALVVMATGAGKTRTVIALADLLMRCNWAKRVLFLADRVALVKQAVNAFKAHLPDSSPVNLVTEKNTEGRVYVSTYPTMMGLIDEAQDGQRRFGVGHFDLIIIDEAHRSIYKKYRAIFDYFDVLLVGLTATPKDEIDHNTYSVFDLESGVPTDAYALDEAVGDNYLVPPKPISVPLKFQREGIKYDDLSDEEKEQWDELEWNEEGSSPNEVDAAALNTWLFNTDTVDKVLAHVMTRGIKVAGGDRLGKTIIFAKNNDHAEFIADRFNKAYPHYKGEFARVITYKTEYAQSLIDSFSVKDSMPQIAISVDMLDTGIDVPEVVNLAFFKQVRSKTKFWQMVGRGTRLCPNLFAPGQDKEFFYIFDYCQNLEFFSQDLKTIEGNTGQSLSARLFNARLQILAELDHRMPQEAEEESLLRADTASYLHQQVASMNIDNFVVRPQRRLVEEFSKAESWLNVANERMIEVSNHLADLPNEMPDEDEEAKRFDLIIMRTQLAILQAKPEFKTLREKVMEIATALELQENIPAIRAHIVLIQSLLSEDWWQDVTVGMLEHVRKQLRALVKLIEKGKRKVVYTDFEDELGEDTEVELPEVSSGLNYERFKEKARQFLKAHEDHLALQRLKRNQPLTSADLVELERMLIEAGGTKDVIDRAKERSNGLGLFIRSLVGLDYETAKRTFSEFVTGTYVTANQIEFIDLIIEELTKNGVMEPDRLYEAPFTDIHSQGAAGIFSIEKADQIRDILVEIRQHAQA